MKHIIKAEDFTGGEARYCLASSVGRGTDKKLEIVVSIPEGIIDYQITTGTTTAHATSLYLAINLYNGLP